MCIIMIIIKHARIRAKPSALSQNPGPIATTHTHADVSACIYCAHSLMGVITTMESATKILVAGIYYSNKNQQGVQSSMD